MPTIVGTGGERVKGFEAVYRMVGTFRPGIPQTGVTSFFLSMPTIVGKSREGSTVTDTIVEFFNDIIYCFIKLHGQNI